MAGNLSLTFLITVLQISCVRCQFLNCNWIKTLDCTNYIHEQLCGTDGVTYRNRCYFAYAQCNNPTIHILSTGPCLSMTVPSITTRRWMFTLQPPTTPPTFALGSATTPPPPPTPSSTTKPPTVALGSTTNAPSATPSSTTKPPTTTTVQSAIDTLHVLCESLAHAHCANYVEPLCGSNGRTYISTCEFQKDVCLYHDLTEKHSGFC